MASVDETLQGLTQVDGAMGACIVDYTSGLMLGSAGSGVDLELAAAGNTRVMRAKMDTMKSLGIEGEIEDVLITLENQIHILRPTHNHEDLFIYLVLDKAKSNLALARRAVKSAEENLSF